MSSALWVLLPIISVTFLEANKMYFLNESESNQNFLFWTDRVVLEKEIAPLVFHIEEQCEDQEEVHLPKYHVLTKSNFDEKNTNVLKPEMNATNIYSAVFNQYLMKGENKKIIEEKNREMWDHHRNESDYDQPAVHSHYSWRMQGIPVLYDSIVKLKHASGEKKITLKVSRNREAGISSDDWTNFTLHPEITAKSKIRLFCLFFAKIDKESKWVIVVLDWLGNPPWWKLQKWQNIFGKISKKLHSMFWWGHLRNNCFLVWFLSSKRHLSAIWEVFVWAHHPKSI